MSWLTIINYEIEAEHKSKSAAVFWAQCTHDTNDRPRKEGVCYVLHRTTIVKRETWERWMNSEKKGILKF